MNDMSGRFLAGTAVEAPVEGIGFAHRRLTAPRAFVDAASLVDDALVQLRAAEHALERQLGDLRAYLASPASVAAN